MPSFDEKVLIPSNGPSEVTRSARAGFPLQRSNAVWDLTAIPPETPLRLDIVLEFNPPAPSVIKHLSANPVSRKSTQSVEVDEAQIPIRLLHNVSTLDRVAAFKSFASHLIPSPSTMECDDHEDIMTDEIRILEHPAHRRDIVLYYDDQQMEDYDYIYEYPLKDQDIIKIVPSSIPNRSLMSSKDMPLS